MDDSQQVMSATDALAAWVAGDHDDVISERALLCARHAVLDWLGVTLAGSRENVARILINDAIAHGETGDVPIVGSAEQLTPAFAALVNGTTSHALDFDDINKRMRGHPTVAVLPAILAAAQTNRSSGLDVLEALVVGNETACVIGEMLGGEHYFRGFHTTATAGTIAAAAGVSRLLRLDSGQTAMALGLAATQAAGLRAMFGSMAKPMHAGKAAMNGLLAARWAASGMTSNPQALDGELGFGATLSDASTSLGVRQDRNAPFGIEGNIYKYQAACYYTHSAIASLGSMMREYRLQSQDAVEVTVFLLPNLLDVCDIRTPVSGLEIKFSIRHLLAMVLAGIDTSDVTNYNEQLARDSQLCSLRDRITVETEAFDSRTASRVRVALADGTCHEKAIDIGVPAQDLERQLEQLSAKFLSLAVPVIGEQAARAASELVLKLDQLDSLDELFDRVSER